MSPFNILDFLRDFILSFFLGKSVDYNIGKARGEYDEKENAVTQAIRLEKQLTFYDGLEDELKETKDMLVGIVSSENVAPYFNYLKKELREPDWTWDGNPYAFEELMRDAVEHNESLPKNTAEQFQFARIAGAFESIAKSDYFTQLLNHAKYTTEHIQRKPLVYDKYVAEQEALYDAYPWLPQAIQNIPADSEDPTLSTILQAFNDIHTKIDTVVEELTATDTSLEEQINSLLGIETSLEGHEINLSTAVANIPTTIATMAPIYPVCSCGAGSTAGVSDGVSGETFVEDIVSGVVTGVGRMEVKVNEQVFGEMVDRRNNQNLKNALAGRGFSWV